MLVRAVCAILGRHGSSLEAIEDTMREPAPCYDVVVIGAGAAGVAAATAAARNRATALLIESTPAIGGGLLGGLPLDGCLNARGEWIVGGCVRELIDECKALGGYVGPVFDWRLNWGVCYDPEIMRLAVAGVLRRYDVSLLLYSLVEGTDVSGGCVKGITVVSKAGRTRIKGKMYVDCSGDGDLAVLAGADYDKGGSHEEFQPISLVFRMSQVDFDGYLEFVRDHPVEYLLAESPVIEKTPAQCAEALWQAGYPFTALSAKGALLGQAIRCGEMFPTTALYMWPTSLVKREVGVNATRMANIDATDTTQLSHSYTDLHQQVQTCVTFLRGRVPGFQDAVLASVAPGIGVRETRRIAGEVVLTKEDVLEGRKRADGVAKGSHHIDLHGAGMEQTRVPVKDGRSYDIPYGCLIPKGLDNLLVAGRCLSSTRDANGSARVMGTCMATGQAAGTAAALCARQGHDDPRDLPVQMLRRTLLAQGAVLDGTH